MASCGGAAHIKPVASKSSVETNTDKTYRNYYKINRGTLVRDAHYSSSYQIAHCNARPISPPQSSPGFPPQRLKPSRTEGNFEVGYAYGTWDASTSPSQIHGSGIGYCDRSIETGSMYKNRSDRQSHETFAHSLRRYPYSPERSISSELVQKLLNYTQNKYLTKSTPKSQRSLNRGRSPYSSISNVKQSKHIQTYTRTKREYRTRDCGANTSHDLKFLINKKGRSYSTLKCRRYKDENNNTSYDYLESPTTSRHSPHTSEVRYVRDVKKYIRDTIEQIYKDKPMVCPRIKGRYSHHRKLFHKDQSPSHSAEVQASVPTTSRNAFTSYCEPPPGSHSYIADISNVNTSDIICCRCYKPKPCVCKLKADKTADVVKQQIADWVEELPAYTENTRKNKREKEKIIKDIQDIISKIPKDDDYFDNIKNEITSYIENLSIWDPGEDETDEGNKNEITDSLLERLKTVEDKILAAVTDIIRKWLDDLQLDRNINMDKTAKNFASHLTPLLKDVEQLKNKLKELLRNLPITKEEEIIDDIFNDIINDLIELSDTSDRPVLTEQELENEINKFIEAYPDINHGNKVKNLARKLNNTQITPLNEREREHKMKDNVGHWIDSLPKNARESLSPKQKEVFSDDLIDKLQNATNLKAMAKEKKSPLQIQNEIENEIWGILESMDIHQSDLDKSLVKGYAMKLREINKSDFDEEDFANATIDFLNELDESGIPVRSRDQDTFHNKILEKLKAMKAKDRQSGCDRQSSFSTSTPKTKSPLQTQNEIENEIWDFLESMDTDQNDLDKSLVKGYAMKLREINKSDFDEKDFVNATIDFLNELNKSGVPVISRDQDTFYNKILGKLKTIKAKDRQTGGGRQSSFSKSTPKKKSPLETQNEIENEIWGLLESMDVDQNDVDESTVKGYAMKLKGMNKSGFDEENFTNATIDFLNELDKSGVPVISRDQDKFYNKVKEKLKKIKAKDRQSSGGRQSSFATSTPKKGGGPNKDFNVTTIGEGDDFNYSIASPTGLKNTETQYNNDLNKQIESWVETLPINLDREKTSNKTIINDLANDIMDRQKYLQIHPDAAKSDAEELDHLKYQVFRWLNKMNKVKDREMAAVMDKTQNLMNKIKNVHVPRFVKSNVRSPSAEKSFGSQPEKKIVGSPRKEKRFGSPNTEKRIRSPIRERSLMSVAEGKIYGSPNREESFGSQVGEKIVGSPTTEKKLGSPAKEKTILSPTTSREISLVSPSREKNIGSPTREQSLVSVTKEKRLRSPTRGQSLMSVYSQKSGGSSAREKQIGASSRDKSFGSVTGEKIIGSPTHERNFESASGEQSFDNKTYIPTQNASIFIKENLDGAISDWFKQLPLYDRANPDQKRKFDKLVPELSKAIKRGFDDIDDLDQDINKLVKDEIEKQLMKQFPISFEDYNDKKCISQAAAQLLQHLKDQQMFQDISDRTYVPQDEYLNQYVDDWANLLPLRHLSSPENKDFENLKNEFTSKLKKAREDRVDDDTLKSEISKYLKKFPLKDTLRRNKEYQDRKVEELLKALSTLPTAIASRKIPDIHHFVRQAVVKWMQKLPLDRGKTVSDIPEDAIENTVNKISDGLTLSHEIPLERVKKTVEDATVKLLDQIPLDSKKTHDAKALAGDLFKHVENIPKKLIKDIQPSYGAGSSEKYAKDDDTVLTNELKTTVGDNLSGAILDWIKQKPDYLYKKAEYDKLASNLAKNVKTTLKKSKGEDQNKVLIDEMTKQFKNTPLESRNAGDATEVLQYLKDLQMLQENSGTTIQNDIEDLANIINNFAKNSLNLKKVTWCEKKKFGELKSELIAKLKKKINDRVDRDALKNEIKYYLCRFPISEDERKDDRFLDKKAEELLDSLFINENNPDVYSYVRKGFMKWMKNVPLEKGKNINDIPREVVDQIARRLSEQIIHSDVVAIGDIKEIIEEATIKFLEISPLDRNISYDIKQLAKDLFDSIKGSSKGKVKTSKYNDKTTKGSTPKSAKASEPRSSKSKDIKASIPSSEDETASRSTSKSSYKDKIAENSVPTSTKASEPRPSSKARSTETSVPKSSSKDKTTNISVLTSTETLLSHKSGSMHPSFKSAADQLADNVEQWVNNLPIKEDTQEERSKASNLKRYLTSRIISKVSELNTNPEIFNDDFLYEEMFEDEVDNIIKLLSNEGPQSNILAHKKSLIDIVKDGRLKTQEEMAGTVYKQQLRDVISKNVPSESLNENENASFEVLKEDVADAFVSLHYVRGEKEDAKSKAQFKNNVKNEIDEFCSEYLKLHPKRVVDAEKLKSNLYKALKDVPVPNDKTMRHEIELIKIKELINQWIHESKLLGNQTGVDKLKTKKKISVLARKVHEIEKLKESNPDFDSNDMLKKEIIKWLEKMPLVVKNDLDILAEELIKKLKETEEMRKSLRSYSSGKESTLPASSYSNEPWSSPLDSDSPPRSSTGARCSSTPKPTIPSKVVRRSVTDDISRVPEVSERTTETVETSSIPEFTIVPSPCAPPCALPPSTLSPEDREYLRKIRERATQSRKQSSSKDAAVNPAPFDYSSQTKITTDMTTTTPQAQSTPLQAQYSNQTSEPVETSKPGMQAAGSQVEVVPRVIVKEYYWDSIDSKMSPCSRNFTCPTTPDPLIPEVTCSSRPSYSYPYRTSQHTQTAPPSPQDYDPDCSYLPDFSLPCKSNSKRCNKSYHNVGPNIKGSNRNLPWSKEDVYGDRRKPFEEEEIIIDMGRRRKLSCRCKDRVTSSGTKKRECKSCRINDESLKRCPKCCGVHCPYPSYLYFK